MTRDTVMRATWLGLGACGLGVLVGLVVAVQPAGFLIGLGIVALFVAIACLLWLVGSLALRGARD